MDENGRAMAIFMDVQRGLPRQGPGCADATRRALQACTGLPARPAILDIGCGPGLQTLVLAEQTGGAVTAVDTAPEYLDALRASAAAAGLADRIAAQTGDMNDLPFEPARFDLIWAEGSAYIMGVGNALKAWRRFLKPGGYLALSELVWRTGTPPAPVRSFFEQAYPAMGDAAATAALFAGSGYRLVDQFTLPDDAWWPDYYTPLQAKLPALREKYRGDPLAQGILDETETEIDMRRTYAAAYGYEFFVGRVA